MIFALIGLNFCVVGLTIYASGRRASSHAVEPDYDRKALNWNQAARQIAHNKDLGWSLELTEVGRDSLSVSLMDRDGRPIRKAQVSLEAFHHAHAGNRIYADLRDLDGRYSASLAVNRPGLWEFQFTVKHQGQTFTSSATRILTEAGS